ncbi:hypothetical protein [Thioclava atlantica]|uniref:Uncharacterized protein n=1 Tax=Thioclava atlantica TaxID=1317124 RepID=A0A085TT90_9RHOB|nr:hypothetical protein [Thioclava atlantica]KFE33937.1 hypothetical protein DW2_15765 [Thioclava atlantica]
MASDLTFRRPARLGWLRHLWVLAGLSVLIALALLGPEQRGEAGAWLIRDAVSAARLFPLVGLGIALALAPRRAAGTAAALWVAGMAAGLVFRVEIMAALQQIPGAITHHFLTLPISAIAIGATLALGRWPRPVLIQPAALIVGAMYALATKLSDPSYGGAPWIFAAGAALAIWLIGAVYLVLRSWNARWFEIAGRIVGSWLVAIGLLYGGVALMGGKLKPKTQTPANAASENAPAPQAAVPGADEFPSFGAPPSSAPPGARTPDFQP